MLNQSFSQVFVTNSSAILASGSTVANLAVGQIGIIDANTYFATTTPTYAINKALKIPVDLLVNSEEEVREKQELPGHVVRTAIREGIML